MVDAQRQIAVIHVRATKSLWDLFFSILQLPKLSLISICFVTVKFENFLLRNI